MARLVYSDLRILPVCLFLSACSTQKWSEKADKEVYGIIEQKQVSLFGDAEQFDVKTPHSDIDPSEIQAVEIINDRRTGSSRKITIDEAISISIENRREYQNEKEALYLTGLDLTRARHDYSPRFSASSQARIDQTTYLETDDRSNETFRQASINNRLGFDQLLRTGGGLAIDLAQDIFKFYIGGDGSPGPTRFLAATLRQPLLRGAGKIATENLTQRERNVAYSIRSFSRFQQRNVLDVTNAYFRVLREKDLVRNEYSNYRNLIIFTERATELAKDRLPRLQVDQAKQTELRARSRYISAVNSYGNLIDNFKITLGMPMGNELFLDDDALFDLANQPLTPVPLSEQEALEIAITNRLDLLNEIDRFEDAKRRMEVAADAFKPGLDIFATASTDSNSRDGASSYSNFNVDAYNAGIGIELNLPLDNLEARNSFRRARIDFERQLRQLSLALDNLHADLRAGLRGLELARQTFEIQQTALSLADRRVDSTNELLEAARAQTRDLLDSRNDQLTARNAVTAALINYHTTRMTFLYDLGVFNPEKSRFWVENPHILAIARNDERAAPVGNSLDQPLISPEELFKEPASPRP